MRFIPLFLLLWLSTTVRGAEEDVWQQIRELEKAGKKAEARMLVQKRVQDSRKTPNTAPMDVIPVLQRAGQFYARQSEYAETRKYLEEILDICRQHDGPKSLSTATAWYELGWFQQSQGEYRKAQLSLEKALGLREARSGRHHESVAECLNGLGVVMENQGKYDLSEAYYQEALALRSELLGPEHSATLTTRNNLATLYWSRGDYAPAERNFTEVWKTRQRTLGPKAFATLTSLNNLALLYRSMGDYVRAEKLFREVLKSREESIGALHPFTLTTLHQLGLLYADQRKFSQAEPLLLRAAEGRQQSAGPEHPDTARSFFHLAWFYDRSGDFRKAEPLHRRSLEMRLRILGEEHPETAGSYGFLARHYHLQGKLKEAKPFYDKALALQTPILGENHPDRLKTVENLACWHLDQGNRTEALKLVRQAVGIRERMLENLFAFASEQQRMDFQKTLSLVHLPASLGSAEDIARVVFRTKGLVLDSVLEDQIRARGLDDPDLGLLIKRLEGITQTRLQVEMINTDRDAGDNYAEKQRLEDLFRDERELQSQFVRRVTGADKGRRGLQTESDDIRKTLGRNTVLVEWLRYEAYDGHLKSYPAYGALLVFRDQPMSWVPLGRADLIDPLILKYQKVMRRRVSNSSMQEVLQELGKKLWSPLKASLPEDVQEVVLCPDGLLNFVSFATLLDEESRFLSETWLFTYLSSSRDLLRPPSALPLNKSVAVFANPDYRMNPLSVKTQEAGEEKELVAALRQFDGIRLKDLKGSQEEADWLKEHAFALNLKVSTYTGDQATESALTSLGSPTILHLATHGVFLNESTTGKSGSADEVAVALKNPMQRSMFMLAGAQKTLDAWKRGVVPDTRQDGIVTAAEVGALNLQGTWLVVLSACETGQGEVQAGEGVLGLRRGFVRAGALNLMLTLWPVADTETVPLIRAFYERAFQEDDPARALAEVQRERLVELRKKQGLSQAVRLAGPFILSR